MSNTGNIWKILTLPLQKNKLQELETVGLQCLYRIMFDSRNFYVIWRQKCEQKEEKNSKFRFGKSERKKKLEAS